MTAIFGFDPADALRVLADELDAHPHLPRPEFIAVHLPHAPDLPITASFRFEKAQDTGDRRANVAAVDAWAAAWGARVEPQISGNRGCRTQVGGVQIRALRPAYEPRDLDEPGRHPEHTHRATPDAA